MSNIGTVVNPATIQVGDSIATKTKVVGFDPETGADIISVVKSRKVKRVGFCSKPENYHLDHECYDTRFATVVKK